MRFFPQHHRVFLLRCWKENVTLMDSNQARWRFSLEEVSPQRWRKGFVALKDLFAFLRKEFDDEKETSSPQA